MLLKELLNLNEFVRTPKGDGDNDPKHIQYDNFDFWKADVKKGGYRAVKTTVTNYNTYYKALGKAPVGIVGFFNTGVGKKGSDIENQRGFGGQLINFGQNEED